MGKKRSPFRVLVACVISQRTKDEVTREAAARLLSRARTPGELAQLSQEEVARLIYPAGFYRTKAAQLLKIAQILLDQYGGQVPATRQALLALPGVGPKTANLVLGLGYGVPAICVDTHVHRIANRLGLVQARTPEETEQALTKLFPRKHWIALNDLLVSFGQKVCTPISPRCSGCPISTFCPKNGVTRRR
ncbi:MAG: endonuclease III domain-containing protein [Thermoanaerobaculaceae bacterium]